ncbi:MAG: hypothetical protein SNJ53_06060 [Thermodesulfovibrionales bacterium]
MLSITYFIVKDVLGSLHDEYRYLYTSKHASEIKTIIDLAISEITSLGLLENEKVKMAKEKSIFYDVTLYWENNSLEGVIFSYDGSVIHSSLESLQPSDLVKYLSSDYFVVSTTDRYYHGFVINVPV